MPECLEKEQIRREIFNMFGCDSTQAKANKITYSLINLQLKIINAKDFELELALRSKSIIALKKELIELFQVGINEKFTIYDEARAIESFYEHKKSIDPATTSVLNYYSYRKQILESK